MEGEYLELSPFSYHFHTVPYNSYPSPLEAIRFLTKIKKYINLVKVKNSQQGITKYLYSLKKKKKKTLVTKTLGIFPSILL